MRESPFSIGILGIHSLIPYESGQLVYEQLPSSLNAAASSKKSTPCHSGRILSSLHLHHRHPSRLRWAPNGHSSDRKWHVLLSYCYLSLFSYILLYIYIYLDDISFILFFALPEAVWDEVRVKICAFFSSVNSVWTLNILSKWCRNFPSNIRLHQSDLCLGPWVFITPVWSLIRKEMSRCMPWDSVKMLSYNVTWPRFHADS